MVDTIFVFVWFRLFPCSQSWKWGYDPAADVPSASGFVGLVNPGCVCYCNALLQQLFMTKHFRSAILRAAPTSAAVATVDEDNKLLLRRLQTLFGFLQESKRKAFQPTEFLRAFKVRVGVAACG